jgi:hypothetical protein
MNLTCQKQTKPKEQYDNGVTRTIGKEQTDSSSRYLEDSILLFTPVISAR